MISKTLKKNIVKRGDYEFNMDRFITANLDVILKEAIPNNWDSLMIVFGKEGSGKSTLAVQVCKFLDESFSVDQVVFTPKQFEEACESAKPEQSILWDEAITGANISKQASSISVSIVSKLTQIRKKKLKIVLCFPYLYMMNKYFISRCIASFYVYARGFNKRGFCHFYNSTQTEHLYNLMKERFRYHYRGAIDCCSKSFSGNFNKSFPIDMFAYDEKKETSRMFGDKKSDKRVCSHTSFRYLKKNKIWECRTCGYETKVCPFENEELKGERVKTKDLMKNDKQKTT